MKYALLVALAFTLVGAGCLGGSSDSNTVDTATETILEEQITLPNGEYVLAEDALLNWEGTAIGKKHTGTLEFIGGELLVAEGTVQRAVFELDMTTINSTDMEGALKEQLDNHLKADDFFGVETHPTALLEISRTEGNELIGELTVKGITNEVRIPYTVTANDDGTLTGTATYDMDRTKWDVRYGSLVFFSDLGDKAISDIMTITMNLTFAPKAE